MGTISLQIFLTLPVTVANAEWSFSKLKLIKNHLRSLLGQQKLADLAVMGIESDLTRATNFEDIIDSFARATNFEDIIDSFARYQTSQELWNQKGPFCKK